MENKITKKSRVRPDLDPTQLVCCKNITRGKLIYISKRLQGFRVEWQEFNDDAHIELIELEAMRNNYPAYFKKPYIVIDEPNAKEILQYLRVEKYYENIIDLDNFDDIFKKPISQFKKILEKLPEGFKNSVVLRAKELKETGDLDSLKVIKAIEEILNVDLNF